MRIITATQFYIPSWVGFLESLFYKRVILQNVKTENFRGNNAWIIGKFNIIVTKHLCCTMYCEIQAQCLPTWKRQRSIDTHQSHFKRAVCVCVSVAQSYLTLRPHGLQPTRLLCPRGSPGKSTGVCCHFLFQRIFPTQGQNPRFLHYRWILYSGRFWASK